MQSGSTRYYSIRRIQIFFTFHSPAAKVTFSSLFLEKLGAAGPFVSSERTFYCYLTACIRLAFLFCSQAVSKEKPRTRRDTTGAGDFIDPAGSATADRDKKSFVA